MLMQGRTQESLGSLRKNLNHSQSTVQFFWRGSRPSWVRPCANVKPIKKLPFPPQVNHPFRYKCKSVQLHSSDCTQMEMIDDKLLCLMIDNCIAEIYRSGIIKEVTLRMILTRG